MIELAAVVVILMTLGLSNHMNVKSMALKSVIIQGLALPGTAIAQQKLAVIGSATSMTRMAVSVVLTGIISIL